MRFFVLFSIHVEAALGEFKIRVKRKTGTDKKTILDFLSLFEEKIKLTIIVEWKSYFSLYFFIFAFFRLNVKQIYQQTDSIGGSQDIYRVPIITEMTCKKTFFCIFCACHERVFFLKNWLYTEHPTEVKKNETLRFPASNRIHLQRKRSKDYNCIMIWQMSFSCFTSKPF